MQIKTFCGCCSLQIGSIIIGVLSLLFGLSLLILQTVALNHIEDNPNPEFRMGTYFVIKGVIATVIAFFVIWLILSTLLIIGTIKRKASYVFPFVCLSFSNVLGELAASIGIIIFTLQYPLPATAMYVNFLIISLFMGLYVYVWLVVYSFYHELIREKFGYSLNREGKIYEPYKGHNV
ncbi:lysosomal-associated transmembrane protein 4A [Microplitis demolitor]|uniref:lysosomal-associated transmembrane protein 4A n=1 Tax=Microplitis demolitor TaxID=69319 RepID=UPI0004CD97DB|nr:lysosomal-associated transmembrane protein 4A [Microplitis demolitor]